MLQRLLRAVLFLMALPIAADAATLWVATNGMDTPGANTVDATGNFWGANAKAP